ncbi:hypothetical protein FGRMN_5657 [Fusarium graminum]|nr:hypothetical protein FGRMN_5657 [Fusarium graminum]
MTPPELHVVDPDGDTLLILYHPDAPFAICGAEKMWPNTLPQYQSTESKEHEESVIPTSVPSALDIASSDTSKSPQPETEKEVQRYKLCSHFLKRTCSYFSGLMSGEWQAVLIVMNILHHNIKAVPRTLTLEMLAKIAVIVDYYGCHEAVGHWAETWIAKLEFDLPEYYSRNLLLRLTVAVVFADYQSFYFLTKTIIGASRGPFHTLGLPIPQRIVGKLWHILHIEAGADYSRDDVESKRQQAITQLVLDLQSMWKGMNQEQSTSSEPRFQRENIQCKYMRLGYLDQNLFKSGLKPLPVAPFPGISFNALTGALESFDTITKCPCPLLGTLARVGRVPAHREVVARKLETYEDVKYVVVCESFSIKNLSHPTVDPNDNVTEYTFKDILTGDVLFSDAFPIREVQGAVYEVDCEMVKIEGVEEIDSDDDVYVNNVVHSFRLQPMSSSFDKRSYTGHLKGYLTSLHAKMIEQGRDQAYIAEFKKNVQAFAKSRILSHFGDYEFYTGESVEDFGMIALMNYREDSNTPYLTFWKYGLEETQA